MAAALVQRLPPGKVEDMRVRLCSRLSPFPPYRRRPASVTGRVQGCLGLEPTRPPQGPARAPPAARRPRVREIDT